MRSLLAFWIGGAGGGSVAVVIPPESLDNIFRTHSGAPGDIFRGASGVRMASVFRGRLFDAPPGNFDDLPGTFDSPGARPSLFRRSRRPLFDDNPGNFDDLPGNFDGPS